MDHTQGNAYLWRCGEKCFGVAWTDYVCHCACVLPSECLEIEGVDDCVVEYEKTGILPTYQPQDTQVLTTQIPNAGSGNQGSNTGSNGNTGNTGSNNGNNNGNNNAGSNNGNSGVNNGVSNGGSQSNNGGSNNGGQGINTGGQNTLAPSGQFTKSDGDGATTAIIVLSAIAGCVIIGVAIFFFCVYVWMDVPPEWVRDCFGMKRRSNVAVISWTTGMVSWKLGNKGKKTAPGATVPGSPRDIENSLKAVHKVHMDIQSITEPVKLSGQKSGTSMGSGGSGRLSFSKHSPRNQDGSPRGQNRSPGNSPRTSVTSAGNERRKSLTSPRNSLLSNGPPGAVRDPSTSPRGRSSAQSQNSVQQRSTSPNANSSQPGSARQRSRSPAQQRLSADQHTGSLRATGQAGNEGSPRLSVRSR